MAKNNQKSFALKDIVKYNEEVLFPFMEETFITKKDAKNFAAKDDLKNFATKKDLENFATKKDLENFATKDDLKNFATKDDLTEFKDEILTRQDEMLEKLSMLLEEKTIGDDQNKRQKKVLEIHNNALKKHKIISETEISEIHKLRVF